MVNKSGKRATKVSAFTDREWQDIRSLLAKAGSQEELFQRIRECPPAEPPGRRQRNFFRDISISDGPKGLQVVRFTVGPENYVAVIDPEPRTLKPGLLKYERLRPTISAIVETMWNAEGDPSRRMAASKGAVTDWVIDKLRTTAKAKK